jgi:hypothetical protein
MRSSVFLSSRLPRTTIAAFLALSALPAATSAQGPTPLVVGGTEGRDEVSLEAIGDKTRIRVSGAATVTGEGCAPVVDRLGTTTATECSRRGPVQITLGGNDDLLSVELQGVDQPPSVTADGGAGNDVLVVASSGARTLRGDLGDDTLVPVLASGASEAPATLEGGAGRDLADYADSPGGVNASIATRSATVFSSIRRDPTSGQTISSSSPIRNDSLSDIERLSGSREADSLTGGPLADELLGQGAADILEGGDGADILDGGPGTDALNGGLGGDTQIGGPGRDTFRLGNGGDNYQTRDGFVEDIQCARADSLVGDLVDRIASPANCNPLSIAAGKHVFDTQLSPRALVVRAGRAVRTPISCPEDKPEECAGKLRLLVAGDVLTRARYRVRPGRTRTVLFRLTPAEAARARRAGRATLEGLETDDDGRPRRVVRQLRVSR